MRYYSTVPTNEQTLEDIGINIMPKIHNIFLDDTLSIIYSNPSFSFLNVETNESKKILFHIGKKLIEYEGNIWGIIDNYDKTKQPYNRIKCNTHNHCFNEDDFKIVKFYKKSHS